MLHARLYVFVGGLIAGTVLTYTFTTRWSTSVFLCLGFVSAGIVSHFLFRRCRLSTALIAMCFFGMSLGAARVSLWMSFNHAGVLDQLVNKKVSILAIVSEEPQASEKSLKVIVKTLPNIASNTASANVSVTADRYSTVAYGDLIKLHGKIIVPKPIKSAEGDFAYDVYLARQGIFYTMTYPSMTIVEHHKGNIVREYLIAIKNNFLSKINRLFAAPKSGFLAGLLISGRSSISKSDQEMFTRAGLIHIVALSGFNVTIIAQAFMAILVFLPKRIRLLVGALGIIAFVTMAGFGSTIVRAGIMALLVIAAALVYRTYHVGRALFIAALCMIIWHPMVVFDVSFQLSCIATFAVIFAVEPALDRHKAITKILPEKFQIREIMFGTLVIEIFLLPILLTTAGAISIVTVITNLLVLPLLPVVMGFGFAATLVGYIHELLSLPIVAVTNLMLEYILLVTRFFANIPFGVVSFEIPKWSVFAMYAVLGIWLWRLQKFKMKKEILEKQNTADKFAAASAVSTFKTSLTSANLERLDSFFRSHSNSNSQKKP